MPARDALEILRAHGRNSTSFQLLEPGIEHWFSEHRVAFVGYADTGAAWVALGEPVAAPEDAAAVRSEFVAAAAEAGRRVRFFAVEAPPASDGKSLQIGEEALWTGEAWSQALAKKRSLREQLRRAKAKGVKTSLVDGDVARAEIEELASQWSATRSMASMRFAVRLDLFKNASERRYIVARVGDQAVAALVAVPIYARSGWLIEDLLRSPSAPNGTTELLVDAAMRELDDAELVSMGMAPLSGVESRVLRGVRATTPWLFDWNGLRAFKAKLGPSEWRPLFVTWERGGAMGAMVDVLRSFAGGGLLAFGARTTIHRYRAVLWLLAILLVPWIAALATPQALRFFPSEEARALWIGFDALLFVGLVVLASSFHRGLAQLLCLAALLDLAFGLWQLAAWNANVAAGFDWLPIGASLVAPSIAFIFLFKLARCEQLSPATDVVEDPIAT